jgi:CubicO group peptidase (beta-lactamase class C family)
VLLVAREGKIVFLEPVGSRSLIPQSLPMSSDAIFDLASLTKVFATTPAVMRLVDQGKINLDQPLAELLPRTKMGDKKNLTPRLLLCHSAGLTDWKPYYEKLMHHPVEERRKILRQLIIEEPFAYEPGKGNLYSDLGFMLLEWVIEERAGDALPEFVERLFYRPMGLKRTFFVPVTEEENPSRPPFTKGGKDNEKKGNERIVFEKDHLIYSKEEFAATENCPWRKKVLQGEVHDDNAWALGGYSGHAGLFSTAEEVYDVANMMREHFLGLRKDFFKPETVREFLRRQDLVEGSDWALGWDTRALQASSAGKCFSRESVGHTGFTGTSIWMDLIKDVIAIFLTNRVHPKRDNDRFKQFRPLIHDAIMQELGLANT